jgi:hypothetical protein
VDSSSAAAAVGSDNAIPAAVDSSSAAAAVGSDKTFHTI